MTTQGYIRDGAIVLQCPAPLPNGTQVEVEIREISKAASQRAKREVARLTEGIDYDFEAFERLREVSKL